MQSGAGGCGLWAHCRTRCRGAPSARAWPPCASAAAWELLCASNAISDLETGEERMSRVAVVTGGTRGIGRAISIALKNAGYRVAATYGGNDKAAQQFNEETGIPVFKFDVADFNACAAGVKKIEAELGPIEVLVNNAGITRHSTIHRMSSEHSPAVIHTTLSS